MAISVPSRMGLAFLLKKFGVTQAPLRLAVVAQKLQQHLSLSLACSQGFPLCGDDWRNGLESYPHLGLSCFITFIYIYNCTSIHKPWHCKCKGECSLGRRIICLWVCELDQSWLSTTYQLGCTSEQRGLKIRQSFQANIASESTTQMELGTLKTLKVANNCRTSMVRLKNFDWDLYQWKPLWIPSLMPKNASDLPLLALMGGGIPADQTWPWRITHL